MITMLRNDTTNERNEMINVEKKNLDKLVQTFLRRGHDWLNAVRLAKSSLTIINNGHKVSLRKWVRVDD